MAARKTITSDTITNVNKNSRRVQEQPLVTTELRPQKDVLDHGLEDYEWHYLWVSANDTMQIHGYYQDGYRFVAYSDVKKQLEADERTKYLFRETVDNRVGFGDTLLLMKIPQRAYQERLRIGLSISPGKNAQAAFEERMDTIARTNDLTSTSAPRVSVDTNHGEVTTETVGNEEK